MTDLATYLSAFWQKPFDPNGSVLNWALFVLLLLVLVWIWSSVLAYAKPVAEAAASAI